MKYIALPLTIIIPVRNEEDTIGGTLELLEKRVHTKHRVLVVDDVIMPSDRTLHIAKRYQNKYENIFILKKQSRHPSGFSAAIWRGIQAVPKGVIVFVMADQCDDYNDIDRMFGKILKGNDVVCGSRYMPRGKKVGGPKLQGFFSYCINSSLFYLLRLPTKDVSNAFKMYRRTIFDSIPKPVSTGFEVSMELFFSTYFNGAKITEIPTIWRGRTNGKSKFNYIERVPQYIRIYLHILNNYRSMLAHKSLTSSANS